MSSLFEKYFVGRINTNFMLQSEDETNFKCYFGGVAETDRIETRFKHFVTLSRECFSENSKQSNLSIFTDPNTDLPEWKAIATDDDFLIADAKLFYLEFEYNNWEGSGSRVGGQPLFLHQAQANLLKPILDEKNKGFLLQFDEEDFFPTDTPNIDKALRDILCGGILYVFASFNYEDNLIDFTDCIFDHHI